MKRKEDYVSKFRRESPILNPNMRTPQNGELFNENSVGDLTSRIYELEGSPSNPGHYLDGENGKHMQSYLPFCQEMLQKIELEYKRYQQVQMNSGNLKPSEWPAELAEKKLEAQARVTVASEEITWLKDRLQKIQENEAKNQPEKTSGLFSNRQQWGTGKLRNGILVSIGGQKCGLNKKGILEITDDKSPYFGMEVWKFKGEICGPMFREHRFRCRQEEKNALRENRPKRNVPFPARPKYDKKTGVISYPRYSQNTLSKLQKA